MSFEDSLPVYHQLEQTLQAEAYQQLPSDWIVVIADVRNSTNAIEQGRYREVNALGGSTIAAVLNAVKPMAVPYVFGGDGAAFCIPPLILPQVQKALRGCRQFAKETLALDLRIGLIPCTELQRPVAVCKFQTAETLVQYFFAGGGMQEADDKLKQNARYYLDGNGESEADFSGFECRWNEIPSPRQVTCSLLVMARSEVETERFELYRDLIEQMAKRFGDNRRAHPLHLSGLSLSLSPTKLKVERMSKVWRRGIWRRGKAFLSLWLENVLGNYFMRHGITVKDVPWGRYREDLIANSDRLKLDDAYRTVLAADRIPLQELLQWLDQQYRLGRLYYGCHQTHSAIVTCLINQRGLEHIHFVDSAEGGYAMAAKQLKQQMREARTDSSQERG
ncbi:DUF3095 family protein [Thiomicrorhabdus sp. zzn3]|uniref:DUF3095 family protein n=1 Tax=Thiomicrorhabdus sp. zzn3 TaxID=3039775 RepID=UPI0024366CC2|nr:DUF3095 family protein [Thiomicrorhabdus sp. zzn3]MDG6777093.1 DUF3095 family protein [Thiomicrorhabdus sp. zzn3]